MTSSLQSVHAEFSDSHPFSPFEGDLVSTVFAVLDMGNYRALDLVSGSDLARLNALNQAYDHIHNMRVVPFDLRSFSELVGSALGPMVPLLPYILDLPEP